jgi:hypothetical protein
MRILRLAKGTACEIDSMKWDAPHNCKVYTALFFAAVVANNCNFAIAKKDRRAVSHSTVSFVANASSVLSSVKARGLQSLCFEWGCRTYIRKEIHYVNAHDSQVQPPAFAVARPVHGTARRDE